MNYNFFIKLINVEIKKKNFQKAKELLFEAIKIYNKSFELFYNLGLVNRHLGKIDEAIVCFKKAIKINSDFTPAYNILGSIYNEIGNKDLALRNYLKAIEINPNYFNAIYNLANFYFVSEDIVNAEKYFNLSINVNPNHVNPYNNLLQIYDRSNNLEKFEETLNRAKKVFGSNKFIKFFEGVYAYRKKQFKSAISLFENFEPDRSELSKNILRANILAKSYDNLKLYEKAFSYYEETNSILKKNYLKKFNKERYLDLVEKRLKYFSNNNLKINKIENFKDKNNLVFLIGFPRSGTTLLDTILRTHKDVKILEEKPLIDKMISELDKCLCKDFSNLENLDKNQILQIQKIYFKERDKLINVNKKEIFIDKLPLNIIFVAEIVKIFPSAKFILAIRNPYDSVLSCFMQPFLPNDAMSNFLNLKDSVNFYDRIMKLWNIYQTKLDLNIHVIKYEDVVNDFDMSLKNLLNFLNLQWSENLRNFYLTANKNRLINTPSYNQVNQPIYKESINRWINYEEKFEDFKNILNKWVEYFEYN